MTRRPTRIAIVVVALLLAAPAWNLVATSAEHRRNPVPGTFHDIGGYRMHLDCTGRGRPTVLLEAAASATWMAWRRVQPALSKQTRVCSYDRAGHGWSDPRPGLRDADHVVPELHELLAAAGVERPFIYVGHSAGGLYAREYARRYPEDVAGVALLDASSPQQIDELPGWRAQYERNRAAYPGQLRREKLRVWSGWERLRGSCRLTGSDEAPAIIGQYSAMMCRAGFVGGDESEYVFFEETSRQAARLQSFGDVPLLIVSRDPAAEPDTSAESRAQERVWDEEQERSRSLARRSWRVIARGAGHSVQHDRLDLVVGELQVLLAQVRGDSVAPFGGTTTK